MKRPVKMPTFRSAPTKERLRAANDNHTTTDGVSRVSDWPIARLLADHRIDREEAAAGERLAELHHYAGANPLQAIDYSHTRVDGGTGGNTVDGRFGAKLKFRRAVESAGDLARLVVAVACDGHMPAEHQIRTLRIGLRRVAEHLGVVTRAA